MTVNSQKPFNEKPTLVFRSGVLCCMSVYTCGVTSRWGEWGELMAFVAHGHTFGKAVLRQSAVTSMQLTLANVVVVPGMVPVLVL